MDNFDSYIESLPEVLSKQEERALFANFWSTKNEESRQLIIEHCLRKIARAVNSFLDKGDKEDMMQIATVAFIEALDEYKGNSIDEFFKFAKSNMNAALKAEAYRVNKYAEKVVDNREIGNSNGEVFGSIIDEDEWLKDIVFDDTLKGFFDNCNDYDRYIIESLMGINGKPKLGKRELTEILQEHGLNRNRINLAIKRFREYYFDGVIQMDESTKIAANILKTTTDEKNRYILESYYGLNGREKISAIAIAEELGTTEPKVIYYISNLLKRSGKKSKSYQEIDVEDVQRYVDSLDDGKKKVVLEYLFGLNGRPKLEKLEIAKVTGYSYNNVCSIEKQIYDYLPRIIAREEYSGVSRMVDLDKIKEYVMAHADEEMTYVLESLYGLNDREKKTRLQLSEELGIPKTTLQKRVNKLLAKINDIELVK